MYEIHGIENVTYNNPSAAAHELNTLTSQINVKSLWNQLCQIDLNQNVFSIEKHNVRWYDLGCVNGEPTKRALAKCASKNNVAYNVGWLTNFWVDAYISLVVKIANKESKSKQYRCLNSMITRKIFDEEANNDNLLRTAKKTIIINNAFADVIFFPRFHHGHITLIVWSGEDSSLTHFNSLFALTTVPHKIKENFTSFIKAMNERFHLTMETNINDRPGNSTFTARQQ